MSERIFHVVALRDTRDGLSLEDLAACAGVHPEMVERLLDYGLLDPLQTDVRPPRFAVAAVARLQSIQRLRGDIGINLAGIAVVLDLVDRLRELERDLDHLRGARATDQ